MLYSQQLACTACCTKPTVHAVQMSDTHLKDVFPRPVGWHSLLNKAYSQCSAQGQTHLTDAVFGAVGLRQCALNQLCTLTHSSWTLTLKPGPAHTAFDSRSQAQKAKCSLDFTHHSTACHKHRKETATLILHSILQSVTSTESKLYLDFTQHCCFQSLNLYSCRKAQMFC